jgi:hypothetical protein
MITADRDRGLKYKAAGAVTVDNQKDCLGAKKQ